MDFKGDKAHYFQSKIHFIFYFRMYSYISCSEIKMNKMPFISMVILLNNK